MTFLDETYLLKTTTAEQIFKEIKDLPILDAHNHSDVREIAENKYYNDIFFVEAATDHYVWELMRKRGVEEKFITGDASPKEKWMALAGVFEEFAGNPTYEWIHMDLQRRFCITELINSANAESIWEETSKLLKQDKMRPQSVLKDMKVEVMCSTDDPIDMLESHNILKEVKDIPRILPTWRPDKSMNIFKDEYVPYIHKLEERVGKKFESIDDVINALQETHDYFEEMGCRASDHGVHTPFGYKVEKEKANAAFKKKMAGNALSDSEVGEYISFMMHQFGRMNADSGWVTQIHIGAVRDYRESLFEHLGPDTGGDISDYSVEIAAPLKDFLNAFDGKLKVVLYSMDPTHWMTLATITRAFGKNVNLGSAWWLNDTPIGMKRQLELYASIDLLMNFAGMVTDSRKLMSYGSRTEMFRRVLSDVLGNMVKKGQIPQKVAVKIAKHICYEGPKEFFGF